MTPFGEYIEQLRRQRNVTQTFLAQKLGVSPGYLSAIENGRKVPNTTDLISQLVEHLNLTDSEYQALLDTHNQSKLLWRVPKNIQTEEFRFLSELWDQLGSLSAEKLQTMQMLLRMENKESKNCSCDRKLTQN